MGAAVALYLQTGATGSRGNLLLPLAYTITLALLARNSNQALQAFKKTPLIIFLLALPFLSAVWSVSASLTIYRAATLAMSMGLAYLIAVRFTPPQLLVLAVISFFPALAVSLAGLVFAPSMVTMSDGSISGIFNHKNVFGWYSAVTLVAGLIATYQATLPKFTGLVIVATSFACLVASGSTTSLISVIAAVATVLFYGPFGRLPGVQKAFILCVLLQAAAAFFLLWDVSGQSAELFGKDASLTGRVPLWHYVDEAIWEKPILGYGYFSFWSEGSGAGWKIRSEINWDSPTAHSGFRDILLAFGVTGFLPFMWVVIAAIWRGARLHSLETNGRWLGINVLMVMFIILNVTETIFYVPQSSLFIIFMAAVVMVREQGHITLPYRSQCCLAGR